ncbi:thioester reductase domain-containing protein, partial [Streptomyces sp. NPDC079020]|uniref:thioester reductase domain-containing protein n=1 Tax=Streptomyces sp. NPDC079020 TaxID=3365722 RepID=UPI0037CCFFAB
RNVVRLFTHAVADYDLGPDDVWTLFHSYSFDVSVWEMWGALAHGGRLVILPHPTTRSPEALLDVLRTEGITVLSQTPTALRNLVNAFNGSGVDPSIFDLRYVFSAGEELTVLPRSGFFPSDEGGDGLGPKLVNMYGITETTIHATHARVRFGADGAISTSIGRPLPDVHILILDRHLQPAPIGTPGEMFIGGPALARGYLNNPQLTDERFIDNPHRPGHRLYRSGDLGLYQPDGCIRYLGRKDRQIKVHGYRIEPAEIENALRAVTGIADALVTIHQTPQGPRLTAYLIPAPHHPPQRQTIVSALRQTLPSYMTPTHYYTVPALPTTTNSKTDHHQLHATGTPLTTEHTPTTPTTPTQHHLLTTWTNLLNTPCTDPAANFFELGGNSITALQAVVVANEAGMPLKVADLYVSPTVTELAEMVDRRLEAGEEPRGEDGREESALADADARLDPSLEFQPTGPTPLGPEHILLTGATGFLGGYLLAELLRSTVATVHCLVRAEDVRTGLDRVAEALKKADLTVDSNRIRVVLGDLSAEGLGIDADTAIGLATQVDTVVHAAATVHGARPYATLRLVNVHGTAALLGFAAKCARPVAFHHISSDSAARPWQSGYGLSKLVAERLVLAAGDRGLSVAVHRLGRVSASASTGRWQDGDFASMVIRGSIELGLFPNPEELPIERWSPVDELVSLLAAHVMNGVAATPALRYVVGELVSYRDVLEWVGSSGIELEITPLADWRQAVKKNPANPAFGILAWLTEGNPKAPRSERRGEAEIHRILLNAKIDANTFQRYLASVLVGS